MSPARPIVFLTDYGVEDELVGVCHAVVARVEPGVRVIDLSHGIPRGDVRRGALTLAHAVPYAPPDSVFLAVVDPGVGTERRALVVEAGDALLVSPDNGLLSLTWEVVGGAARAFAIESQEVMWPMVSETFHGRDVFAPAAAHLAVGLPPERVGPELDPASLARVTMPPARIEPGRVRCEVIAVDAFGNARLSARPRHLREAGLDRRGELRLAAGAAPASRVRRARTFGELPEGAPGLLVDSWGWLQVAVNRGSAAETFGLRPGDAVGIGEG